MNWSDIDKFSKKLLSRLLSKLNKEQESEESLQDSFIYNHYVNYKKFDPNRGYSAFAKRILFKRVAYTFVAAALFFSLMFGANLVINSLKSVNKGQEGATALEGSTTPVKKRAKLILSDGAEVDLTGDGNSLLAEGGKIVNVGPQGVDYRGLNGTEEVAGTSFTGGEVAYNTIEIPRGGEYSLTLEDGSVVWLNADSKLRYPVTFVEGKRRVFLEGEAYFEVKKDATKPFIVSTSAGDITVLGTSFNVKNYSNEPGIFTTLVEGSVSFMIANGSKERVILPGQQLSYLPEQGLMEVKEVNVLDVISWKERYFRFTDMPLESIMNALSRWFDVEISYENPKIKERCFSGNLDRYSTIEPFIKVIESGSGLSFKLEGNRLIINSNNSNN